MNGHQNAVYMIATSGGMEEKVARNDRYSLKGDKVIGPKAHKPTYPHYIFSFLFYRMNLSPVYLHNVSLCLSLLFFFFFFNCIHVENQNSRFIQLLEYTLSKKKQFVSEHIYIYIYILITL